MHLGGRYLIIVAGPMGTRRTDLANLVAGGVAYLSTVTELQGSQVVEGVMVGARPKEHASCVVISPDDVLWHEDGGKRVFTYRGEEGLQYGREDALRRVRIAMHKKIAVIVVHGNYLVYSDIKPMLDLARSECYETMALGTLDLRKSVYAARLAQQGINCPVNTAFAGWCLEEREGTYVCPEERKRSKPVVPRESVLEEESSQQPYCVTFDKVDRNTAAAAAFLRRVMGIGSMTHGNNLVRTLQADKRVTLPAPPELRLYDKKQRARFLLRMEEAGLSGTVQPISEEAALP